MTGSFSIQAGTAGGPEMRDTSDELSVRGPCRFSTAHGRGTSPCATPFSIG